MDFLLLTGGMQKLATRLPVADQVHFSPLVMSHFKSLSMTMTIVFLAFATHTSANMTSFSPLATSRYHTQGWTQ
jgi:hypothetical protein